MPPAGDASGEGNPNTEGEKDVHDDAGSSLAQGGRTGQEVTVVERETKKGEDLTGKDKKKESEGEGGEEKDGEEEKEGEGEGEKKVDAGEGATPTLGKALEDSEMWGRDDFAN